MTDRWSWPAIGHPRNRKVWTRKKETYLWNRKSTTDRLWNMLQALQYVVNDWYEPYLSSAKCVKIDFLTNFTKKNLVFHFLLLFFLCWMRKMTCFYNDDLKLSSLKLSPLKLQKKTKLRNGEYLLIKKWADILKAEQLIYKNVYFYVTSFLRKTLNSQHTLKKFPFFEIP